MQKISHRTQSFDGFTLDLTRCCLLRGTQEIKLAPKPFDALTYLVDNPGRLISKAELMEALWPDTAVTPDSLVQCLRDVRLALGDQDQQIIKTVPRRGYIFDREVKANVPSAPVTTFMEETGVQLIIEEEETSGHSEIATSALPDTLSARLLPAHRGVNIERVKSAIKQHKLVAAVGVLTLAAIAVAAIVYFRMPGEAIDSVAVMPFVNVSGDPNAEYLSEGISDSIINSLSRLPNLRVNSLNSVLRYKGKQIDTQGVGRELNVRALLIGRVTQRGDDLTISAELVDVSDNRRLWGQQYSRKLSDILVVQNEIAREISERLRLPLTGEEKKQLAKQSTANNDAYLLYSLGNYYFRQNTKEAFEKSIESFEQAIKLDPNYALAYAGIAGTYMFMISRGFLRSQEYEQKVEWAALKALQLDDSLAEAHVSLGVHKFINFDWVGAEKEIKRGLEIDPNSSQANSSYASYLWAQGEPMRAFCTRYGLGNWNQGLTAEKALLLTTWRASMTKQLSCTGRTWRKSRIMLRRRFYLGRLMLRRGCLRRASRRCKRVWSSMLLLSIRGAGIDTRCLPTPTLPQVGATRRCKYSASRRNWRSNGTSRPITSPSSTPVSATKIAPLSG